MRVWADSLVLGSEGVVLGIRRLRLFSLYAKGNDETDLEQQAQGNGEHELAEYIGRCDHRGNDKGPDNTVAAHAAQLVDGDDTALDQQHDGHWYLECHSKGNEHGHDKVEIGLDVGRWGDGLR